MPKVFSEKDEEEIRGKLLKAAREMVVKYGVKKTRVEDITTETGVAKGTFYKFFSSKEEIFFDLLMEDEKVLYEKFYKESFESSNPLGKTIENVISFSCAAAYDFPLLKIFSEDNALDRFLMKVPKEKALKHLRDEEVHFLPVFKKWQQENRIKKSVDIRAVSALLRAAFFMGLHKDEISEDDFSGVVKLFAKSVALGICEKDELC